jgi:hypothetical protein
MTKTAIKGISDQSQYRYSHSQSTKEGRLVLTFSQKVDQAVLMALYVVTQVGEILL